MKEADGAAKHGEGKARSRRSATARHGAPTQAPAQGQPPAGPRRKR